MPIQLANCHPSTKSQAQTIKMFSMLPPHSVPTHTFNLGQSYQFSPAVSSPLSSSPLRSSPSPLGDRDLNIPSSPPSIHDDQDKMMTSPTPASKQTIFQPLQPVNMTSALPSPPPSRGKDGCANGNVTGFRMRTEKKRAHQANPLLRKDEDGRETRRKLFLKKVREGSEEKRWRDRKGGEEMMRVLWISEERERARKLQAGMRGSEVGVEDLFEDGGENFDEMMADEVAVREAEELEALLSDMLPSVQENERGLQQFQSVPQGEQTPYGSDDEEYDDIFMDVAKEETRMSIQPQPLQHRQPLEYLQDQETEMMDMS